MTYDVVVVGGGITGAGIFRQAVHQGYKTLLVEQRDFAWGTSSRSSKLVHGGLRYLKEGRIGLVRDSVRERQALLREAPGLVEPLPFLVPDYKGTGPPGWVLKTGLAVYDLLALTWEHRWMGREDFLLSCPHVRTEGLTGGARFMDAQVDDARLVLRLIFEGQAGGGEARNGVRAHLPYRTGGLVRLTLEEEDGSTEVEAKVVINATGAWAGLLQERLPGRLRPLRGSHIVFPSWRVPCPCAVSYLHPRDRRPGFLIPWEGATFCGTTDLDHPDPLAEEPRISTEEMDYLLEGLNHAFPTFELTPADVVSTWAGVRPVISSGDHVDPSEETRDHALWEDDGVVTVTGGKLTTFRLMAREALRSASRYLRDPTRSDLFPFSQSSVATPRLSGRYGEWAKEVEELGEPELVPGTRTSWGELRWAARTEQVRHLDDLMLRRSRLGLLLPHGGAEHRVRIGRVCQEELGWSEERWNQEWEEYTRLWASSYAPPGA